MLFDSEVSTLVKLFAKTTEDLRGNFAWKAKWQIHNKMLCWEIRITSSWILIVRSTRAKMEIFPPKREINWKKLWDHLLVTAQSVNNYTLLPINEQENDFKIA